MHDRTGLDITKSVSGPSTIRPIIEQHDCSIINPQARAPVVRGAATAGQGLEARSYYRRAALDGKGRRRGRTEELVEAQPCCFAVDAADVDPAACRGCSRLAWVRS
jgi:hypothetical protein